MNRQLVLGKTGIGSPIQWQGVPNWHAYITGASGFGKTYELRSMAAQVPGFGGRAIIFDYTGDFVTKYPQQNWPPAGTEVINIRSGEISLNPFIAETMVETDEEIAERVVAIINQGIRLGSSQWAYLYDVILSNLPQGRLASIADLVSCIEEDTQKKDVAARILPKIKILGKLLPSGAEYFEWKFNIPGITIVDLSSVRDTKALTVLVEMLLWNICSDRMGSVSKDPSPLVLLLDECQRLRFNDGDTSVRILREGRKYGIWGWFSTQWIDDKTASKALAQAGIRLIFHPDEDSLHNTARRLAHGDLRKSEMIEKRLSNLKQGQFILQKGSQLIISQPPIH